MLKIKKKSHIRAIGYLGIGVTVLCLILKVMNCAQVSVQERADMGILLGLIVGFSLINSAAMLELRNKLNSMSKRR